MVDNSKKQAFKYSWAKSYPYKNISHSNKNNNDSRVICIFIQLFKKDMSIHIYLSSQVPSHRVFNMSYITAGPAPLLLPAFVVKKFRQRELVMPLPHGQRSSRISITRSCPMLPNVAHREINNSNAPHTYRGKTKKM